MTLAALMRKGGLREVATATLATVATQGTDKLPTVAKVATVAVADSTNPTTIDRETSGFHWQDAELRALVDAVAAFHGFTPEQTAEAQEIAHADLDAALECFRVLAARIPQPANRNDEEHSHAGIT